MTELHDLIRLDDFGNLYFSLKGETMTQSQRTTLNWMCREGSLRKHAVKLGNKWFIKKEALNGF